MIRSSPDNADMRCGLRPPQFSTRALLGLMTGSALVLAVMVRVSPLAACAVLLLVLAVLAHVAGNVIGTQLRADGSRPRADDASPPGKPATEPVRPPDPAESRPAPQHALNQRQPLGPAMWGSILTGAAGATVLGGVVLALVNWPRANVANIALGAFSFGVVGGLLGFAAGSFVQVTWNAWSQARRHSGESPPARPRDPVRHP
jgi:hypothetical protein